jgi:uncharacterized iron-regulated protein
MHLRRRTVTPALLSLAACAHPAFTWPQASADSVDGYREAFVAAAGTRFTESSTQAELRAQLPGVRVLWLGDYHRSSRLHGLQNELLSRLAASGRPFVLALESIGEQDEPFVQRYLAGDWTMEEVRAAMRARWPGSWLDDRELDSWYYRRLLSFAKAHRVPVAALEPTPRPPLARRDERIAERLAAIANAHGDRLVVVVVGQAHLLGVGDLVRRTGLPSLAIGGEPPDALRDAAPADAARGAMLRSDGGLWWFAELVRR